MWHDTNKRRAKRLSKYIEIRSVEIFSGIS